MMGHFSRDCRRPRQQDSKNKGFGITSKTREVSEPNSKAMVAIDGLGFDWSFMADEEEWRY